MSKYKVEMFHLDNNYPQISHEEFIEKITEYKKTMNQTIKDELVLSNLKLVLSVIQRYSQKSYNLDDLFQVGIIGLVKSIDHFDLKYNVRFSTYAVPLIMGEIKRYIRDNTAFRISRSIHDMAYKVLIETEHFIQLYNKEPSLKELSILLETQESQLVDALRSTQSVASLSMDVHSDGEKTVELIDQIPFFKNESLESNNNMDLKNAMNYLDEKEKYIIKKRYYDDLTQSEVAKELFISQAQVSRVEKQALAHLKKYME